MRRARHPSAPGRLFTPQALYLAAAGGFAAVGLATAAAGGAALWRARNAPPPPSQQPVAPSQQPVAPPQQPVAPQQEPVAPQQEPVAPLQEPVAPLSKWITTHGFALNKRQAAFFDDLGAEFRRPSIRFVEYSADLTLDALTPGRFAGLAREVWPNVGEHLPARVAAYAAGQPGAEAARHTPLALRPADEAAAYIAQARGKEPRDQNVKYFDATANALEIATGERRGRVTLLLPFDILDAPPAGPEAEAYYALAVALAALAFSRPGFSKVKIEHKAKLGELVLRYLFEDAALPAE